MLGEDDTTPRISLSSTYQGCLNGIDPSDNTVTFTLYPVVIRRDDPFLISPDVLYNEGKVPDALYTKEYWYTSNLNLYPIIIQLNNIDRIEVNDYFLKPTEEVIQWLLKESSNDYGVNILPELLRRLNKCNNIFDITSLHEEDVLKVVIDFDIVEINE